MALEGEQIRINGVNLNVYVKEGKGPAVLLLHGFTDSSALWRGVIPALVQEGYTVVAPDQRGFGESEAPAGRLNYRMATLVNDAIAILDALDIHKAHLVGHDWGALVGWNLAGQHGSRFHRYAALSVGHPATQAGGDWEQKKKTWFRIFFRLRGIPEWVLRARDWTVFRKLVRHHPETESWIKDLARHGRLTAALNWYRANIMELYMISEHPKVDIPVMGVWSSEDLALAESQMTDSKRYVENTFRYERLEGCSHWIPLDEPEALVTMLLEFFSDGARKVHPSNLDRERIRISGTASGVTD